VDQAVEDAEGERVVVEAARRGEERGGRGHRGRERLEVE
jgi:hypothetical protein